ncbi:hypothetical protein GCM10009552_34670 [Rothia nasimurium]|uniref:Sugar acetyltransferase n=1 Tax=Luteibacter anthropi TaxID=564369 RepID=A0A7X5UEF2_9GAMM|nr:NeuD/PglB/VioB family sugar acetyltransferase [Luteibacter anthropi]NII08970.1 sugar acetyltransferase [Luteibacter anthropi]
MKSVIFWGATGQARVLREALGYLDLQLVALFDNRDIAPPFTNVPLHLGQAGFLDWKSGYDGPGDLYFCVAIGGARGADRRHMQAWLISHGLTPLTVVHPRAFIASDTQLGAGCQILAMSAVAAGTCLGDAVIINTSASVDHECVLGHGVHIGPGARLAGEVVVGDDVFVGAGAVVLPRLHIGQGAIVGAGAVVTRHIESGETVAGNPARPLRSSI